MSALIYGRNLSKAFGVKGLFTDLTLGVSDHDRIGVIGPNGAGKSTLLRIFAGLEEADAGTVTRRQNLRITYIPQQSNFESEATVAEEIERAARSSGLAANEHEARVQETLGRTGFLSGDQPVDSLSGGWKKRLSMACGFVQEPDVMLIDEPTNHLDLEGIRWLMELLTQAPWPWVMVSHDRWLLDQAANKIVELNPRYPEGILLMPGTYSDFLTQREEYQKSQHQQAQVLAGKVRREEEWLKRGPKARTTKAKYRIDSARALQTELAETTNRLRQTDTSIDFVGSGRKTKRLLVAEDLKKVYDKRVLFQNLELVLSPGMALGILGYNGSGKSTLLKLLAKELEPDQGTVTHAEKLQIVYFDQHRERLNPQLTLRRTLSDNGHTVTYRDRTVHLAGWAKQFRFQPEQLDLPVGLLSGGEQSRALIARLMLQPADILIVDEPTNDLDIPTREVLEESLKEFPGALVLVTHDRFMLEEVCTQFIGLEGNGAFGLFSEYTQWEAWLRRQRSPKETVDKGDRRTPKDSHKKNTPKKLSYRDQQEYNSIESRILQAEAAVTASRAKAEDSAIATDHTELQKAYDDLKEAEELVERLYARWTQLEAKRQGQGEKEGEPQGL